ncbi:CynX/NimT family MFS transporter [uncultured Roseobacter sp.]|uniref:MFS transporter n=1 Tax=uncultured Roseobacter sp. TaxID=114847 RepID=UPI00262F5A3D|nr:MFS transporter [uncultured Roseobacter sp.]
MNKRWSVLAVLCLARTCMAFQFQSVAALAPQLSERFALGIADIGILIGLFLGAGIFVAIPGGSLAARFGDRRVTVISLILMIAGALLMVSAEGWWLLALGRALSGIGGVIINVIMTKMVIDWFTGYEIGTAMGVLISTWPFGIAVALLMLPPLAVAGGLTLAWAGLIGTITVSLIALALVYESPPAGDTPAANTAAMPAHWVPLICAALIWGLYNVGLSMVFGFGTLVLAQQAMSATSASSVIGVYILMVGVGVPLGGILSDWLRNRDAVIFASIVFSAAAMPLLIWTPTESATVVYGAAGLFMGLAAGPVMTMPGQALPPAVRAFGMGVFFTIYYALMMSAPGITGAIADRAGDVTMAYWTGCAVFLLCLPALVIFRRTVPADS